MFSFDIYADSTSDLGREFREKYNIFYAPMSVSVDGVEYTADLDWKDFSPQQFYNWMREGKKTLTAQVFAHVYEELFRSSLEKGKDVLENAYGTNQMHTYYIINSICAIITILPASTLACRLLRGRRKAFSNYDKCKMSYKEGLLDYWKNNGLTDAILFAATAIILAIVFASSQKLPTVIYRAPDGIGYISLFPLAFAIFEQIGTLFGGLLLLLLLELAMLGGVFFAQKRWRAVYFVEE